MKKGIALVMALLLLLTGCEGLNASRENRHTVTYLDLFDTVTTISAQSVSAQEFTQASGQIYETLEKYHRLFDIYHEYEGINNLKTVNDCAGIAPVSVDGSIIALLSECKRYYALTQERVNVAMGAVLRLWHEARENALSNPENARLPDMAALEAAAAHCSLDAVVIDEETSSVFITDSLVQLDVGAIAKGWAAQRAAENAPEGFLISVGGNVCATGPKQAPDTPWSVGVQDPAGQGYACVLEISTGSAVTSGDYQRCFTVDGQAYHHIIDPDTLMPASLWRSVTVVCSDSALADALSTALFLLPLEQGRALAESCGVQAMWIASGQVYYTDGFAQLLRDK